jgi:hypothetical protein
VTCPYHYAGLIGLGYFFMSFYYQPNLISRGMQASYAIVKGFIAIALVVRTL